MRKLEAARGRGRDDYPIRAMWNSVLAGIVFQHPSIEGLRRELLRNGQLRWLCGFDPTRGDRQVPPSWVYSRFLTTLLGYSEEVESLFDWLVHALTQQLEDFGQQIAIDGKAL